jgi:hypothetical protein
MLDQRASPRRRLFLGPFAAALFIAGAARAQETESLFTTQTPALVGLSDGPGVNYELCLRFLTSSPGEIIALRFWKDANETGTHTGRLWTASGGRGTVVHVVE